MIIFDKVSKVYDDDTLALDNIELSIEPNEFISVVGPSGAGKTTLLKMLLAEDFPTEGTVFFESANIHDLPKKFVPMYRQRLGTVFQDFRLIPHKNIYENIAFAMEAAGRTDEEIEEDVPHALELVDLSKKMWSFPGQLSGGEKQRAAIARAIVNHPDVLIADEPTGNLDPLNTHDIVQILKKINDLGTTVILTTHNKGVIDELARRVVSLDNGRIVRDDPSGRYVI